MIEHITDHEARGVALLIERYRKPLVSALLRSWLAEVQAVEDALWQVLTQRAINNAVGAQLDVLGRIVGQPREGLSDEQYRVWVAARALVMRSSGMVAQLFAIADKLMSAPMKLEEYYPASQLLRAQDVIDANIGRSIARMFATAKAGGVGTQFVWWATSPPFQFAPTDVVVSSSPYGFAAGALAAVSDGRYLPEFTTIPSDALLTNDFEMLLYDGTSDYLTLG
jgi:hypothetical protein